jgi:RNA polymerase sigma-B factor
MATSTLNAARTRRSQRTNPKQADTTPAESSSFEPDERLNTMLANLAGFAGSADARARLRDDVLRGYLPLARRLAGRFRNRGEEAEDLEQVAMLGLINAVDRFDPSRGASFEFYAIPTIVGELKRHFRNRAWTMHVSRSLQELHLDICRAVPVLSQELQRTPSVADLAHYLDVGAERVLMGIGCADAYRARSLNALVDNDNDTEVGDRIGGTDRDVEMVAERATLRQAIDKLPERERDMLRLRFVDNLTQSEIADKIGVSQMHVSRLLSRAFVVLKEEMMR